MFAVAIVLSYLVGSISFSTLVTRWVAHVDIRQCGSGNAGATNTLRVLGLKWGIVVFVLDVLKGAFVAVLSQFIPYSPSIVIYLCGLAVIVGHNWPVFFRFRGGKGAATAIGVLLVLMPYPALIALAFAGALIALTRYVSLGSLGFATLVPVFFAMMYSRLIPALFAAVVALLAILRHQKNIVRLWQGTERRIFTKSE